jgi:hypothetical protein
MRNPLRAIPPLMLGLACDLPNEPNRSAAALLLYQGNRIAVTVDGNQHDKDDWAATPMTVALLARRGLLSKLVHYDYNNHLGNNSATMATQMTTSVVGAADRFGVSRARLFDNQRQLAKSLAHLTAQIDASTSNNRLVILAAGPMEVLWRAVKAADPSARRHVTVISHSQWNNTHADTPQMTHTASDVRALGVKWVQIRSQQPGLATSTWTPWQWLKAADAEKVRWIYSRMQATGKADVSDAGMCYYMLKEDQSGTPSKLKTYFGNWI